MAFVFKDKMYVTCLFTILAIVSLGNCFPATTSSCDCVLGSTDRLGKNTFLGSTDWEKPNLMRFPWMVDVMTTSDADKYGHLGCTATLISDRHVLAPASCVLPYTAQDVTEMADRLSVPYMDISITASIQRNISTIYVHKNYNYLTRDFDICILELDEPAPYYAMDPVILPQSPFTLSSGKLPTAIAHKDLTFQRLRQMNVSIWSNDECGKHTNITTENLLCVEISDTKDISEGSFGFFGPIFHVLEDGTKELLGIPKGCTYHYGNTSNYMTFNSEYKLVTDGYCSGESAIVYTPVTDLLPWIQNILSERCLCVPKITHLQSLVWKVEKCDLEKRYRCPNRPDWSEEWWGKKEINEHF